MEAAIFNCQCDQMQNCEGGCETIYYVLQPTSAYSGSASHSSGTRRSHNRHYQKVAATSQVLYLVNFTQGVC